MSSEEVETTSVILLENEKIFAMLPDVRKLLGENLDDESVKNCSDDFLARCLRAKDGNVEAAAKLAVAFKAQHEDMATWNASLNPISYEESFYKRFICYPLAVRDSKNRRVYIVQPGKWVVKEQSFEEFIMAAGMMMQYATATNEDDQRYGAVGIIDYAEFTFQHACAVKTGRLVSVGVCAHKGMGVRVKGVHVINHPKIIGYLWSGIKPFVSKKIKQRIQFHGDLESLHKNVQVDKKVLPKCLGGELENEECIDKQLMKDLVNSDEFFRVLFETGFPPK